jgi:tRNA (guanine37-N1)-methyltransferase
MIFDILTIFPDLLESPLNESIIRRAREAEKVTIQVTNIRDFATDKHCMTDDRPFGGGEGMVMKPEPLTAALDSVASEGSKAHVVLLSPQGRQYNQQIAAELSHKKHLVLVCGRYEGVDERFRAKSIDDEISIGDYILTGGELAAMILIDSVTRLLPGVLGCTDSAEKDTFSRQLLKHPQYTRPRIFDDAEVPEVLLSGDHKRIEEYRFIESVIRTLDRRPDLLAQEWFNKQEVALLKKNKLYQQIRVLQEKQ